ncbi:LOW QUALITY PROTEIN: ribonuclease HI-related protein 3 [Geomicrobium sp. JCM 19055]|nr:LOW QUALITY PROTEIN: ribonuclease HI-related protein 3 [Geomicrobium sp. JCM 19055]
MAKKKYYVVWKGRKPGIYTTWAECEAEVKGFKGARFKSYPTYEEAKQAFQSGKSVVASTQKKQSTRTTNQNQRKTSLYYETTSISVDAGTHGNPGPVEYQGVWTEDGQVLFKTKPYPLGTNNMAEFLAIVHALQFQKEKNLNVPIYSDSQTAIGWVNKKKAKATLVVNEKKVSRIWNDVSKAEKWLHQHGIPNQVLKWETKDWGEIKADYGRK